MKVFDLHWKFGKVERITGDNIEDATKRAGIGGGALKALDYWEEVQELPDLEKYLLTKNGDEFHEIPNPEFVRQIRLHKTIKVGDVINVNFANRVFKIPVIKTDSVAIYFG